MGCYDSFLDKNEKLGFCRQAMQKGDKVCVVPVASSSDQSIRPGELRACASSLLCPRELCARRALRGRSGFSTSCLQSEMILPHMPAQPDSYSLRHMFMHLLRSQLASSARAKTDVIRTTAVDTKRKTQRIQNVPCKAETSHRALRDASRHPLARKLNYNECCSVSRSATNSFSAQSTFPRI